MIRKINGQDIAFYPAKTKEDILIFEIGDAVKAFTVLNDSGYCFRFFNGFIYAEGGINALMDFLETASQEDFKRIILSLNA